MTDLERGPSSEGAPTMHASSLNNSPQSYYRRVVERLREMPSSLNDALRQMDEAATIISELQAELWHTKNDLANSSDNYHEVSTRLEARVAELQADRDALKHDIERHLGIIAELKASLAQHLAIIESQAVQIADGRTIYDAANRRALAAESSLSRIKSETVEAAKTFLAAWDSLPPGHYSPVEIQAWLSSDQMKEGVIAIRSLSTDDSEKTAESKHSPSTREG